MACSPIGGTFASSACCPVPVHRFVAARLAALGRVFVLFAMPLCVMQSVVFGLTVSGYGEPIGRFHGIAAHFVAVLLACTFVFCALVAAQCLLLVIFGRRAAQAASMAFQVLFAVGLVQMLFFLPDLIRALRAGGPTHEGAAALAAFPPAWFFAIYEQLSGSGSSADGALAGTALLVTIAATMLAPALYGASYSLSVAAGPRGSAMRAAGERAYESRPRPARAVCQSTAGRRDPLVHASHAFPQPLAPHDVRGVRRVCPRDRRVFSALARLEEGARRLPGAGSGDDVDALVVQFLLLAACA
jgi:hypothetical protein